MRLLAFNDALHALARASASECQCGQGDEDSAHARVPFVFECITSCGGSRTLRRTPGAVCLSHCVPTSTTVGLRLLFAPT